MEFEGMEVSTAHTPTTESDCLLDLDTLFQFGEVETLSLPKSVLSDSLVPPSLSLPPPLQAALRDFLFLFGFCAFLHSPSSSATNVVQSSSSSGSTSMSPPLSGGAPSQGCRESLSPGLEQTVALPLASDGSAPPRPTILTPVLLPPSIPVWNISHSALPGYLGQSAPPESDFTTPPRQTCGLCTIWPSTPSAALQHLFYLISIISIQQW